MIKKLLSLFVLFSAIICSNTLAGIYAENFEKCIVSSITPNEKKTMVRWTYSTLAFHPDFGGKQLFSDTEIDEIDRSMAFIFTRLMTQACRNEAQQASRYEKDGVKKAFGVLGREAVNSLSSHPNVKNRNQKFLSYIDFEYIDKLIENK